jgi:DNA-binding NarL/FixJ family response regulator
MPNATNSPVRPRKAPTPATGTSSTAAKARHRLSGREIEVVRAVARGRTNQEIASELFISLSTVKSHISGIHVKLGMRNRVEIAAWAWENRIVEPA